MGGIAEFLSPAYLNLELFQRVLLFYSMQTDKKSKKKDMDWKDRIEATIRSPKYRKEYQGLFKAESQSEQSVEQIIKEHELFSKKYRLRFPVDPYKPNAAEEYLMWNGGAVQTNYSSLVLFKFKGETFLDVSIDLTMSLDQIMKEIKGLYEFLVEDADEKNDKKAKRKRNRQSKALNPWSVYDKHVFEGKNKNQIAKELAGSKDNPAFNEEVMKMYHRVSHGLKKAEQCIKEVEKEAEYYATLHALTQKTYRSIDDMSRAELKAFAKVAFRAAEILQREKQKT